MALILVVDDHPGVRAVIRRALEEVGHEVVLAVDGVTGLAAFYQLATQRAPDLVLVDRFMPEMDGLQLARQLKVLARGMPVVLMSGDPVWLREELRDAVLNPAAYHTLVKPFTPEALVMAVALALRPPPPGRQQDTAS